MKCPACNSLMIVVEHEKIELDYCVKCTGVWFDAQEIELLMEAMHLEETSLSLDNILTSPEAKSAEKKRNCPICGRRMKKATVDHEREVTIDACSQGEGLWFDSGEVGPLITKAHGKTAEISDSQGPAITLMGEVFKVRD